MKIIQFTVHTHTDILIDLNLCASKRARARESGGEWCGGVPQQGRSSTSRVHTEIHALGSTSAPHTTHMQFSLCKHTFGTRACVLASVHHTLYSAFNTVDK